MLCRFLKVPGNGQGLQGMPHVEILDELTAAQQTQKHKMSTITA